MCSQVQLWAWLFHLWEVAFRKQADAFCGQE